jgi:hypothetical protein
MDYCISIPSYKRSTICNNKTLTTLHNLGIPKSKINVFIAEEDLENYQKDLNPDYYNEIIIGVKGITHQRQFIYEYYPAGTHLVSIDDDVESLDLSMTEYTSADDFFLKAFSLCIDENCFIWGVYPVFNPFFRQHRTPITTNLNYIIAAFYGTIIRPVSEDLKLTITMDGNKEDIERSILYYLKDGKTLRFNQIGFKTKYYGSDGGGLGIFKDRLELMKTNTIAINNRYPDITKIKIRKNGMYEIVFKQKRILPSSIPIEIPEPDESDTPIYLPELENPDDYLEVYNLLNEKTITKQTGSSSRARTFGEYRSIVLGYIKGRATRKYDLSFETKRRPKLYQAVVEFGKKICPFEFETIQINHNVVCPRHIDGGNVGKSLIVSIGDYEGCDLVVEPFGTYNTNCRPLIFDGNKFYHYNTPLIKGDKYSLVFYTNPYK